MEKWQLRNHKGVIVFPEIKHRDKVWLKRKEVLTQSAIEDKDGKTYGVDEETEIWSGSKIKADILSWGPQWCYTYVEHRNKARIYKGNEHREVMSKVGKVLYKLHVLELWIITSWEWLEKWLDWGW